jgi:hypothetical protein
MISKVELAFRLIAVTAKAFLECMECLGKKEIEADKARDEKEEQKSDESDSDTTE